MQIDLSWLIDPIVEQVTANLRNSIQEAKQDIRAPLLVDGYEMARLLSVSRPTIDRLRATGKIPSVLVGSSRRYLPNDVVAALKSEAQVFQNPPAPNQKG